MGQKVHPHGLRIGIIRDWDSRWYSEKNFADLVLEDFNIRKHIKNKFYTAGISRVEIERAANRIKVTIHTAKPGMVIGKGGAGVEELRKDLEAMTGKQISINVIEIKNPDVEAQLVAENIAAQIERRISYRRAMKQAIARALKAGAKGIKTMVSGRLAGAEIARTEWYREGTIPLQKLRADISYGFAEAHTTYGRIGVKVWIYRGDVLPTRKQEKQVEGGEANVNAEAGQI
ncbi:30S ribosomal protein S3 [Thermosediminibacter oceani]|uniref:Small ribosomal subunit protein uS3 n=1 Tax=Thermosediminibacter oceani (strain ATCC BAA-1034 / DSM 16646 / JW/IW-1228P) TaxID=555079 RepID=D9RZL8_THEOJ|nr:30S ribosomal protein S3 [Thermosediminibacter oceani]ADL06916.1 SSU ribosomal protein S3P [Thermosediminibacter oceani DSM 16646]